jgi:hypothetical protein
MGMKISPLASEIAVSASSGQAAQGKQLSTSQNAIPDELIGNQSMLAHSFLYICIRR